jgi:uncharacterized membrane-anchored protein
MTVVRAHNIQQISEDLRQERRKQSGAIQQLWLYEQMMQQVNQTFRGKLLTLENIQKLRSFSKLKRPHADKSHLNPELDNYPLDNPEPNISSYHLPESQISDYDETQYSHALQSNYFS